MALMNLLASLMGQDIETPRPTVGPDGQPIDPNVPAEVDALTVTAPRREPPAPSVEQGPQRVPFNYDNSASVEALSGAMDKYPTPKGGSGNPGLYGLLPERMQHGTLRNVLGAIGDAFLVQSGNAPTYGPRMERQRIGQAMAGYDPNDPASVQATIQRLAATGAPDALEMAKQLYAQGNEYQQNVNTATRDAATAEHQRGTLDARKTELIPKFQERLEGLLANVKTPEQYASVYDRAETMAQRLGPDYTAEDFGLVPPELWTPEATRGFGQSADEILQSGDRAAQRQVSMRNTDVNAASRLQAARETNPTNPVILQHLMNKQSAFEQGKGPPLTQAEQKTFDKFTHTGGRSGRRPKADVTTKTETKYEEGKVYQDANGNKAKYVNGDWVPVK